MCAPLLRPSSHGWVRQPLRQPTKGKAWPVVSQGLAYYKIDGDVYAFSAATNGWDILHLDQAEDAKVALLAPPAILVEHGQKLYVFSGVRGKWSEGLKVPSPAAEGASSKPAG